MAQPTPTEQRALFAQGFKKRMGNLADVGDRIATDVPKIASGLVKEEIFGLPGLVGDLIVPAMSVKGPLALDPAVQKASEKFQEEFGASGLAKKAGVELSDEFLDAEGNLRPEMIGRLLAPGALYAKTAGLAGLFKQAVTKTKARGSGIEKKGTGTAQTREIIKTRKAYKLFEQDPETGTLYPLFVDAKTPVKINEWQTATIPFNFTAPNGKQYVPSKKWDGSAGTGDSIAIPDQATRDMLIEQGYLPQGSKAEKIKAVALRPGWHSGEFPVATHIGPVEIVMGQKMKTRGRNQVWAEVEVPDDVDLQSVADSRASIVKSGPRKGQINRAEAQITDELPMGGSYKYQQGQARDGNWIISGQMRVTRVLDDAEVKAINEAAGMQDLPRMAQLMADKSPTVNVEVGEVVGGKSDKYMKLEKQADEARTSELSDAKTLQMEIQGVTDAFDVAAAKKLDATFEMIGRQMGEDAPYTSKDFTDNVIDEFEGAVDQGMSRADALIDAVRVTTDNYNRTFNADLFNTEDILSDLSKGINEDFGFDAALDARRAGQANRAALEQQLKNAESVTRRADAAASQAELERLAGVTDDMTPDEVFQAISSYVGKDQAGISGAGIPEPKRPQLRVISDNTPVKKAAGGKVDLRSGIGNVFKLYS